MRNWCLQKENKFEVLLVDDLLKGLSVVIYKQPFILKIET